MYSLLVVDDERDVARSIAFDMDWEEMDITAIGCAYDGAAALEYIEQRRVDIVLTDIRMPRVDGILLAQKIAEKWNYVKVVFMTGYDEFEYARQALRYNVVEYVLKPASNEELYAAVDQALRKLKMELKQAAEKEAIQVQWERSRPLLRERLLQQWIINGREPDGEDKEFIWEGRKPGRFMSLLLFRVDNWEPIYEKQEIKYRLVVRNMIQKILLKDRFYPLFENSDADILAVIQEDSVQQVIKAIDEASGMWELFLDSARIMAGCTLSMFYIRKSTETMQIKELYHILKRHSRWHLSSENGELEEIGLPDVSRSFESVEILNEYPKYELCIDMLDLEGALHKVDKIFNSLDLYKGENVFLLIYHHIVEAVVKASCAKGVQIRQWSSELEEGFYNYSGFHSVEQLRDWCREITKRYVEYCTSESEKEYSYLINRAKKWILERIDVSISVSLLAEELYVSPSHLSRVFKRETGKTVIQYIQHCKIERSKELIKQPGIKLYEVAQILGYESVAHFNRIFLREVGMSAKDYQKTL